MIVKKNTLRIFPKKLILLILSFFFMISGQLTVFYTFFALKMFTF